MVWFYLIMAAEAMFFMTEGVIHENWWIALACGLSLVWFTYRGWYVNRRQRSIGQPEGSE